jgi:predicted alpha/beta-hydrolase family hydrolase
VERFLVDGPPDASLTLVLAHGAGAPMDSPFMKTVAAGIAKEGFRVLRFEFPYMHARREGGKRGAPDRPAVLVASWNEAIREAAGTKGAGAVAIGGKSMGGRIASMVADDAGVAGLVCFGYPFHPPGQPEKLRVAHLENLKTPALFLQGTRDTFGTEDEVRQYSLSKKIRILFLPDGDHSFKPRAASGRTEKQNVEQAIAEAATFLKGLAKG